MKLKHAGLFLAPLVVVVACGPATSTLDTPVAPPMSTSAAPTTAAPTTPFTAKPKPQPHKAVTFAPVPMTTNATSGPPCHFRFEQGEPLPDPSCTPGAVQSMSVMAICTSGWATAHRVYFTKAEREAAFAKYGIHTTNPAGWGEYDHLIPLELGGANSASNLWPEQGKIPNPKDAIENALHEAVCSGRVSLTTAQHDIAHDWVTAGTKDIEVGSGLKSASAPATHHVVVVPVTHHAAPATHTAASCQPTTPSGNCYKAGEFCPAADAGTSGTTASGSSIACKSSGTRYRWVSN